MKNLDKALIQEIGGWMLTIIVVLAQTRRAMQNLELAKWTGLTDKTLSRYLDKLETRGRILRTSTGWMLTEGFQLELFDTLRVLSETGPNRTKLSESENLRLDNPIIIIDSTYLNDSVNLINNNNKDPESENLRLDGSEAELNYFRIVGKKRDELLGLVWVTAEYVRAHVEFAQAEGRGEYAVGMAITRMIAHAPQPTRRANGHIENCACAKCAVDTFFQRGPKHDNFICEACNQYPCVCDEHEEDCMCVLCRGQYPERFCTFSLTDTYGDIRGCDQYVEPGHEFCSEHEGEEK